MSISYWQDNTQSSNKAKNYDAVVVGGGISGLSTAYWLEQEDPGLKIALIDKNNIGSGASGRNAGFITCGSVEHFNRMVENLGNELALEIWNFSEKNLTLLKSHIFDSTNDVEFMQNGSFSLASTDPELLELKSTAALMSQNGIPIETLNESEIQSRLGATHFVGGIKYLSDASVHPLKLCRAILAKLSRTTLLVGQEIHDFHSNSTTQSVYIKTQDHILETPLLVLATNGYLPALDPFFADKIFPTRGQILTTSSVPPFMEGPCYANFVLDYFRQLADGRVLIGGFRQLEKTTEVGYSDHTTNKIQSALEDFLQQHLPALNKSKITHRWAGVMGFSKDGQCFVGSLPNQNQVFFLGGFTAHGLGLAFHTAKILVDNIFGRTIPNFISAKRF